jgi:hypothetical protein
VGRDGAEAQKKSIGKQRRLLKALALATVL